MTAVATLPPRVAVPTALHALGAGERLRVFGRCTERGCKYRSVLEVGRVTEVTGTLGNAVDEHSLGRFPEIAGWAKWIGTAALLTDSWFGPDENPLYHGIRCPQHGMLKFAGLRATRVETSLCDDVCAHATGADCRCSCGGANHGVRS